MIRTYYPGAFHVARELFDELRQYTGSTAFRDVLVPWTEKRGQMIVELLAPLTRYGDWRREKYRWADPLEQAYALSRVSDVLLLGFQLAMPGGAERPWAHDLHLDIQWPIVTLDEYRSFCTDLAMTLVDEPDFDPFLHEIVKVEQTDDPGHPVEILESLWPAVMNGELSPVSPTVPHSTTCSSGGIATRTTPRWDGVTTRSGRPTSAGTIAPRRPIT